MGDVKAIGLLCFENERPLKGLIGKLDWKYNGVFTRFVREGTISSSKNEVTYLPFKWNEETMHFLVLGGGENPTPGKRINISDTQRVLLNDKATALGLSGIILEGDSIEKAGESDGI